MMFSSTAQQFFKDAARQVLLHTFIPEGQFKPGLLQDQRPEIIVLGLDKQRHAFLGDGHAIVNHHIGGHAVDKKPDHVEPVVVLFGQKYLFD